MTITNLPEKVATTPIVTYKVMWVDPDDGEHKEVHSGLTLEKALEKVAIYKENFHAYQAAE